MKLIRAARGKTPSISDKAFIAENVSIIGDVEIGPESSVWYSVTIRGDVMPIRIGQRTNIQDNSVLHGTYGQFGCTVGDHVTIGHNVILHGCEIKNRCLIGMGSIVMDGAVIGENSLVAAGSLVTEGKKFPPGSLIMGRPAVAKRQLTEAEITALQASADQYLMYTSWY